MRATGINLGGAFFNPIDTTVAIKQFGRRYEQIKSPLITVNYDRSRRRGYLEKSAYYSLLRFHLLRDSQPGDVRSVLKWIENLCAPSHAIVVASFPQCSRPVSVTDVER